METTKKILELLRQLEVGKKRKENAPNVSAAVVCDIIETAEFHYQREQPMHPAYPAKLCTVITNDSKVHPVQIHIDPARGLYHHFCLMCGGYCNAAAAALIIELEDRQPQMVAEHCSHCGQEILGLL